MADPTRRGVLAVLGFAPAAVPLAARLALPGSDLGAMASLLFPGEATALSAVAPPRFPGDGLVSPSPLIDANLFQQLGSDPSSARRLLDEQQVSRATHLPGEVSPADPAGPRIQFIGLSSRFAGLGEAPFRILLIGWGSYAFTTYRLEDHAFGQLVHMVATQQAGGFGGRGGLHGAECPFLIDDVGSGP